MRVWPTLDTPPAYEASTVLGWKTVYDLCGAPDDSIADLSIGFCPQDLPFLDTSDYGLCYDPRALLESTQFPGEHYVLTCECGVPDDTSIWAPICVSFPDDHSIVWEWDRPRNHHCLQPPYQGDDGFVRWRFSRADYEAQVRAIFISLQQHFAHAPSMDEVLPHVVQDSSTDFAADTRCEMSQVWGGYDCVQSVELAATNLDQLGRRGAPSPSPSLIEVGFFGSEQYKGTALYRQYCPERSELHPRLTRWAVQKAEYIWLSDIYNCFLPVHLEKPPEAGLNDSVRDPKRPERDVHEAGRHYAKLLGAALETELGPGPIVNYVAHSLHVAVPVPARA